MYRAVTGPVNVYKSSISAGSGQMPPKHYWTTSTDVATSLGTGEADFPLSNMLQPIKPSVHAKFVIYLDLE